jgi:hypothetical protein
VSQHILEPLDRAKVAHVVVGYDRPLDELFAQVYTADRPHGDDSGSPTHYLGETWLVGQILDFVAPYAVVPATLRDELREEVLNRSGMNKVVDYRTHRAIALGGSST